MNASRRGALILGGRRRGDRGRTSRSRDRARIRDRRVSASWTHLVLVDARRREERPEADLAEHRLEAGEGEQGGARELVHLVGSERRDRARRAASAGTDDAAPDLPRGSVGADAAETARGRVRREERPRHPGGCAGGASSRARARAEAERGSRRRCHRHRTTVGVRVRRAARSDVRRARRYARQPRTPPTLSSR